LSCFSLAKLASSLSWEKKSWVIMIMSIAFSLINKIWWILSHFTQKIYITLQEFPMKKYSIIWIHIVSSIN
jgi:hypothetical protein